MPEVTRLQPKDFSSDLDEIAREGARRMLALALEAEVEDYIARHQQRDECGRAQVVLNGNARPRKVTLGSGTVEVTKGAGSRQKGLLMAFKLLRMAQDRWRRINGAHLIPLVRAGVGFTAGEQVGRRSAA